MRAQGIETMKLKSTRDAYGEILVELGKQDRRIVVADADLPSSTRTAGFAGEFPERFFNVGVAEQNLYAVAAGLATCNKIVFASTFAVFATERALNQIKQSIAYTGLNVKIVATHGGFSASGDGGSHQTLIDISLMRSLPNMTVIVPADSEQTKQAVTASVAHDGPVYIRLCKTEVPIIFDQSSPFRIGKAISLKEGEDVTVLVTGTLLSRALEAAERVLQHGINARVIHVHTIKPIDREAIIQAARKTGSVVTVEEHSVIGGLGSAVAEVLAEECPVPVRMIGVRDAFGESGTDEDLYEKHGLTAQHIEIVLRDVVESLKKS
jgi:transketolase